jgi:hypothetical protein
MTLRSIVEKHYVPAGVLSEGLTRNALLADLRGNLKLYSRLSAIFFGAICAVTLLAIAALAFDLLKGEKLHISIVAAAGLSIPALLGRMRRAVREWSQTSLMVTLVSHSDERAVQALLDKLLKETN